MKYKLSCSECTNVLDEKDVQSKCKDCNGSLVLEYDLEKLNVERGGDYAELFPLSDYNNAVTLEQGGTPLYKVDKIGKSLGLGNLFVKYEGLNPTGVFKDRGTFVEINKALELGAKSVITASSGNMGASIAAFSAKAGLNCFVLVPEHIPIGKLSQIVSYGAHVVKIVGEYSHCVEMVEQIAEKFGLYLVGDYVFRREGQKDLAFELCEDLNFEPPDALVCPVGAGTNLSALWKGFREFKELGFISRLPKMIGVQADGAAVLVKAFEKGEGEFEPWDKTETLCTGVAVGNPNDGNLALKAVAESKGAIVSVSDDETLKAQFMLSSEEAIFVEPSSALPVAAIPELLKKDLIQKDDVVVCIATGNGLKDPVAPLKQLGTPETLEADIKVVSKYLKSFF